MTIAPIIRALQRCADLFRFKLVHTGQRYDRELLDLRLDMQKYILMVFGKGCLKPRLLVALALVLGLSALVGCGSGLKFKSLRLDGEPDEYRSTNWTLESSVQIDTLLGGLRCVVVGNDDPTKTHSGGIMLPAKGAKGCRLDMKFTDPKSVVIAYVDAHNARNQRVARWQTEQWAKLPRDKKTYVFVPQKSTKSFKPVAVEGKGEIDTFHVYVVTLPGSSASFEISKIELAQ